MQNIVKGTSNNIIILDLKIWFVLECALSLDQSRLGFLHITVRLLLIARTKFNNMVFPRSMTVLFNNFSTLRL